MKRKALVLLLLSLFFLFASCKTKEVPGRVRAPRRCNTCTKWSYAPPIPTEAQLLTGEEV